MWKNHRPPPRMLEKVKGIRPVAICDLNFQRSEQFGKRYNLKYYKNYNEMLSDNIKVDIVSIMTPLRNAF